MGKLVFGHYHFRGCHIRRWANFGGLHCLYETTVATIAAQTGIYLNFSDTRMDQKEHPPALARDTNMMTALLITYSHKSLSVLFRKKWGT